MHVFGPQARYPLDPRRNYTPHECSLAEYQRVMALCGIERAVLVQPSVYGTDNRLLLDALAEGGPSFRAVVVPRADVGDAELEALHAAGARGLRLNLVNPAILSLDDALVLSERVDSLGWHLQLHVALANPTGAEALAHIVSRSRLPIVVDHFGRPAPGSALPALLDLLASGRGWVKFSAPYRVSRERAPHDDLRPLIEQIVAARPDRLLWASDWPHSELSGPAPDDTALVDLVAEWLPEEALRRKVCVDNPAALYHF